MVNIPWLAWAGVAWDCGVCHVVVVNSYITTHSCCRKWRVEGRMPATFHITHLIRTYDTGNLEMQL